MGILVAAAQLAAAQLAAAQLAAAQLLLVVAAAAQQQQQQQQQQSSSSRSADRYLTSIRTRSIPYKNKPGWNAGMSSAEQQSPLCVGHIDAESTSTARNFVLDDYYDDFSIDSESSFTGKEHNKVGGEASLPESIGFVRPSERSKKLHMFCKAAPKIELHAHLNGSIRESTLIDLARERGVTLSSKLHTSEQEFGEEVRGHDHAGTTKRNRDKYRHGSLMYNTKPRSLLECFEIFGEIPKCVNDLQALRRITREALEDFADENVAYLELRSGPKCLIFDSIADKDAGICTKKEYVETIIDVMKEFEDRENERYRSEKAEEADGFFRLPLVPRLLVSVDRSGTLEQAKENVALAIELFQSCNPYIVGVELGGNPTRNDFRLFEPVFQMAREAGLRVAIHCGEIPCASSSSDSDPALSKAYEEAMAILQFKPDRLGHALLLPDTIMEKLLRDPIPIECCPTSNVMTLELALHHGGSLVDGMKMHPQMNEWLLRDYPISINTDDSGLFCTNSTRELLLVAKTYHVNETVLARIILDSVEHSFEPSKDRLASRVQKRIEDILSSLRE